MIKELYSFVVDREEEKEQEVSKTNKKSGETITTTKKVTEKVPVSVILKKPSRRDLEEAELEYSVEMSRCVKKGILTKAMLAKKYSDTGGLMSETDAQELVDSYKKMYELQNEHTRLGLVNEKTKAQEDRLSEIAAEVAATRKSIVEYETNYSSLFDHTADVKAQNRLILWYTLMLTYVKGSEDESPKPFFKGDDFETKLKYYYEMEESEDEFYFVASRKASTALAFWFFNQASDKESFDSLMKRLEKGDS